MIRFFRDWGAFLLLILLSAAANGLKILGILASDANLGTINATQLDVAGAGVSFLLYIAALMVSQIKLRGDRLSRAKSDVDSLFSTASDSLFPEHIQSSIRGNVMVPKGKSLKILMTWKFYNKNELRLAWKKGQGCTGYCWQLATTTDPHEQWRPQIAPDLRSADKAKWNLTDDQVLHTRDVAWVISIPMLLATSKGNRFVGILNFDGTEPLETKIDDPGDFASLCAKWGAYMAQILEKHRIV